MPTIDINDTTLHYERSGEGPAILFVHGMCGDANVWAGQAERSSGHVTYAERPDDFAAAVSAFAAELDRSSPPLSTHGGRLR